MAPDSAPGSVNSRILDRLACSGLHYRQVHHEPTLTSRDRALFRGEPIKIGGKALVLKAGDRGFLQDRFEATEKNHVGSNRPFRQS
jgi:hypothetical protein